jgi:hypothetical protein
VQVDLGGDVASHVGRLVVLEMVSKHVLKITAKEEVKIS